jgi:hypothetical protein
MSDNNFGVIRSLFKGRVQGSLDFLRVVGRKSPCCAARSSSRTGFEGGLPSHRLRPLAFGYHMTQDEVSSEIGGRPIASRPFDRLKLPIP